MSISLTDVFTLNISENEAFFLLLSPGFLFFLGELVSSCWPVIFQGHNKWMSCPPWVEYFENYPCNELIMQVSPLYVLFLNRKQCWQFMCQSCWQVSQATQTISTGVNCFTKWLWNTKFQSGTWINLKRKEMQNLCISLLTGFF